MPTIGNIAQHIGPQTIGTVQETNPAFSTTAGYIRNMGVGDGYQFGTIAYTNSTANSNLTYTPTGYTGGSGYYIMMPAGSYIDSINVDVTTAFNAGTNNVITIALSPTSATAGTTIATVTGTAANIGLGRYSLGITVGSAAFAQTNTAYWANVSNSQTTPTDQFVLCWFSSTGAAATTGAATIGVDYVVRNPDGSWYQQSPVYPITNPPVITY